MGADLVREFPAARKVYEQAEDLLKIPLRKLSFEGPAGELTRTRNAQPAIITHSAAVLAVLAEGGHQPGLAAGHSLGELGAVYAAGVLGLRSALSLAGERGRLMERAGRERKGVMVAVMGLEVDQVRKACEQAADRGSVVLANDNAPLVSVLSGVREAVDRAVELCQQAGKARAIELAVGGAFHSPLMESIAGEWAATVEQVPMHNPAIPVYGNVEAEILRTAQQVKNELIAQITSPIRWREIVGGILEWDPGQLVEVGPGDTLKGLVLRWVRYHSDAETHARWKDAIHLTGTVEQLRTTLQALGS